MWFFSSPAIVFGDGALGNLETIRGQRACIVTDANLVKLGYVERVKSALASTGMQISVIDDVEPDPSLETVKAGAARMLETEPDWIIALGGGSVMDAAKGMWILYEHPDFDPESINPIDVIGLRVKARLIAIPTTAGTGSETTWAIVLTNHAEQRKLGLGNREAVPDIAILDPEFIRDLPKKVTAETGLISATGYACRLRNWCLIICRAATRMVRIWKRAPTCKMPQPLPDWVSETPWLPWRMVWGMPWGVHCISRMDALSPSFCPIQLNIVLKWKAHAMLP
jgi:hypothetical protein